MKNLSKKIAFIACAVLIVVSSFSTFATSNDTNGQNRAKVNSVKNQDAKDKEIVIGKITSITAENVTIDLATRKKREKKADNTNNETNQVNRTKPSAEDRFVLTGESKTYNIASADLGRKSVEKSTTDTKEKVKGEKLTCADYAVGDYVRITVNADSPLVVKRMRHANQGFNSDKVGNGKGNYKGSYTGKTKAEKAAE